MPTVYNPYDSMVRPLHKWLDERGVRFELTTVVTDLMFADEDGLLAVKRIAFRRHGPAMARADIRMLQITPKGELNRTGPCDASRAP